MNTLFRDQKKLGEAGGHQRNVPEKAPEVILVSQWRDGVRCAAEMQLKQVPGVCSSVEKEKAETESRNVVKCGGRKAVWGF